MRTAARKARTARDGRAKTERCTMDLSRKFNRALRALVRVGTPATSSPRTARPSAEFQPLELRQLFSSALAAPAAEVPRPDHVLIVVEENHSYEQILGQQAEQSYAGPPVVPNGDPLNFITSDPYLR